MGYVTNMDQCRSWAILRVWGILQTMDCVTCMSLISNWVSREPKYHTNDTIFCLCDVSTYMSKSKKRLYVPKFYSYTFNDNIL